jgi:5-methyltetrahydrofolate--homocysteine methyltransferase
MNTFVQLLAEKPYLLADGATGTNLFEMGLQTGDSPEFWNVDYPARIAEHYRRFVEAGSDIILTNTFGGNAYRLRLHGGADRVAELNAAAVTIAKQVIADSGRTVAIAGSIGPTGEILEPNGAVTIAEAAEAFREQATALQEAGVDVLWAETLSSKEELDAVTLACRDFDLPLVTTMSFDTNGRTMMGVTPSEFVAISSADERKQHGCGTNCGVGASEVVAAIAVMSAQHAEGCPPLIAKANCGIPEWVDGAIVYNGTLEIMSEYVQLALDAGARIVGGCCGTTPAHVKAMREVMDNYVPRQKPTQEQIESVLGEISLGARAQLAGDNSIEAGSVSGKGKRVRRRSR